MHFMFHVLTGMTLHVFNRDAPRGIQRAKSLQTASIYSPQAQDPKDDEKGEPPQKTGAVAPNTRALRIAGRAHGEADH